MITNLMTNKYDKMVDYNSHTELLVTIAEDFQLQHYVKAFQAVKMLHDIEGHLLYEVYTVRNMYRKEMREVLRNKLSLDDYATISKYI